MRKRWLCLLFIVFTIAKVGLAADFSCQNLIEETSQFKHCKNKLDTYPAPIHFYYPKALDISKPIGINIHFHGHNIKGFEHLNDFGKMLIQSGKNVVVVAPESVGNCETYDKYFKDQVQGLSLIKQLLSQNNFIYAGISFSGHSGAYRVLRTLFSYSHFEENLGLKVLGVGLFDATYASLTSIISFSLSHDDFVFFNSYVDGEKSTTDKISRELKKKYSTSKGFYFYPVKSTPESVLAQHFNILKKPGLATYLDLVF